MTAPALVYAASVKLDPKPAPDSTLTVKPSLVSLATLSGVCATRFSSAADSFGTPIDSSE
eukprot:1504655-Prymnesium_polylepis.2